MSRRAWVLLLAAAPALAGCHRDMYEQAARRPMEPSSLFANGDASRPLEPGTVSREDPPDLGVAETGWENGRLALDLPVTITPGLLARGRTEFGIYCAMCHGADGYGQGIIVQRGFPAPPSFHTDRLRAAPAGHFFDVMTRGYGAMYPYASRVSPADRWAITAYIRALQLSQHVPAAALPADARPPSPAKGAGP
jgi:mono/diheme cytochrome c family protein